MEAKAASDVIVNSLPKGIFALDICAGILGAFCKQIIKTNICFRYLYWHLLGGFCKQFMKWNGAFFAKHFNESSQILQTVFTKSNVCSWYLYILPSQEVFAKTQQGNLDDIS